MGKVHDGLRFAFAVLMMLCLARAQAQSGFSAGNDASSANDLSAPLTQVQLQNWYHASGDDAAGQGNQFF